MHSTGIRGHGGAAAGGNRPILKPLLPNPVRSLDQFTAGLSSMLHHDYNSGVEATLGTLHAGQTRTFSSNHILYRDLGSVGSKHFASNAIPAHRLQILEQKEVRHFGGG